MISRRRAGNAPVRAYTPPVRFRCIVSYRTSRSRRVSTWRASVSAGDLLAATAEAVKKLKRRQRRSLTVVGMYLHLQEPQ